VPHFTRREVRCFWTGMYVGYALGLVIGAAVVLFGR